MSDFSDTENSFAPATTNWASEIQILVNLFFGQKLALSFLH